MADNIALPASGVTALTDDCTTGHAQIVKLAISTDGAATLIPADATNGIDVDVTRVTGTVTVDSELPSAAALADGTANPTAPAVGAFNHAWNGASWDRMTISGAFGDGESNTQKALLTEAYLVGFNGTTWDRVRTDTTNGLWVNVKACASHAVTNAGTFAVQVDGAALTALQLIDDPVIADDAGFTPGTSKVMMAGFQADETATDSVDEGDAGAARMTLDRKVIVTPQPHAIGGLSTMAATSQDGGTALTSTAQAIKASAGQLYGYYIFNPNSSTCFVNFYNTAQGSVTVGTTNPLFHLAVPAGSAANLMFPMGVAFGTAMSWSATATAGSNTAPTTALEAVCWYF